MMSRNNPLIMSGSRPRLRDAGHRGGCRYHGLSTENIGELLWIVREDLLQDEGLLCRETVSRQTGVDAEREVFGIGSFRVSEDSAVGLEAFSGANHRENRR